MKRILLTSAAAVCVLLITSCGTQNSKNARDIQNIPRGGSLVLNAGDITDEASFYPVKVDGTDMEIFAIRDKDGNIRTAFNTCQSCYTSGNGRYEADGKNIVCQNCGFEFTAEEVGIETGGGCNPWPITDKDKTISGDTIEISYDFLTDSKDIFANWK